MRAAPNVDLHPRRRDREPQKRDQQLGVGQIVADRLGHARILDFDDDLATIEQYRPVHLTD
jgi:hypothetical protein